MRRSPYFSDCSGYNIRRKNVRLLRSVSAFYHFCVGQRSRQSTSHATCHHSKSALADLSVEISDSFSEYSVHISVVAVDIDADIKAASFMNRC